MKAVYPGSFDPVTSGHIDIIERASKVFDELIIGVLVNANKKPTFSLEERVSFIERATKDIKNVKVEQFDGLSVDFAKKHDAKIIVRGLRAVSDFVSEIQIAQANHFINEEIDTMFFTTSLKYSFLSSTAVKEMIIFDADISGLVPECVKEDIIKGIKKK